MEVVRYDQLPEMFEAEKTLESGVKADFRALGLSNWKDGVASHRDGKTTNELRSRNLSLGQICLRPVVSQLAPGPQG